MEFERLTFSAMLQIHAEKCSNKISNDPRIVFSNLLEQEKATGFTSNLKDIPSECRKAFKAEIDQIATA